MPEMPTDQYVEIRAGGYYVAGTRIGLDVIVYEFRDGASPEELLQHYPSMQSLAKVYGAITFVLEHPEAVETYLADQERLWQELEQSHPLPEHLMESFLRAKAPVRKSA